MEIHLILAVGLTLALAPPLYIFILHKVLERSTGKRASAGELNKVTLKLILSAPPVLAVTFGFSFGVAGGVTAVPAMVHAYFWGIFGIVALMVGIFALVRHLVKASVSR